VAHHLPEQRAQPALRQRASVVAISNAHPMSRVRGRRKASQAGGAAALRVALLGGGEALVSLRKQMATDGHQVVLELDPETVEGGSHNVLGSLTEVAAGKGQAIDELVVLRTADAFSSLPAMLATLKILDLWGIGFVSLEEPWLAHPGSAAAPRDGLGGLSPALESRAAEFLDLSIERLKADNRASDEQRRKATTQTEVGKVVAQLLVLGPYAVAVGIVSQAVLNAALLDPDLLLRRLRDLVSGTNAVSGAVTGAIPDALRGIVFSAISSLVLLVFRGTSTGLRAELGGALFMGLVTLSVYGLAAGFGTGIIGSLVALPGIVLAVVLTFEFSHMVLRITASTEPGAIPPAVGRGFFVRLRRMLAEFGRKANPAAGPARAAAFVAIPLVGVLLSVGAAFTQGGLLFWPARISLYALALWSAWACLATPSAVRIPLWSMLGWATLLLLLSAATTVTAVFAVVIVLLLAGSVFELIFRHAGEETATAPA
jgi:hypothetical protein